MDVMLSSVLFSPWETFVFSSDTYSCWSVAITSLFCFSFDWLNCPVEICLEWRWEWQQVTVSWMAALRFALYCSLLVSRLITNLDHIVLLINTSKRQHFFFGNFVLAFSGDSVSLYFQFICLLCPWLPFLLSSSSKLIASQHKYINSYWNIYAFGLCQEYSHK